MTAGNVEYRTPLGDAWIEFDDSGSVTRLGLPRTRPPGPHLEPPPSVARLKSALERYWRTGRGLPAPDDYPSHAPTPLLTAIYRIVTEIPAGETMTYREVAAVTGSPARARAVGAAMARNPIPPLIPCHRVVGSNGDLRGYAGGTAMKRYLLELERQHG